MIEIIRDGLLDGGTEQAQKLIDRYKAIILPDRELLKGGDLTHFWIVRCNGIEALYVGTPETFSVYVREVNGLT